MSLTGFDACNILTIKETFTVGFIQNIYTVRTWYNISKRSKFNLWCVYMIYVSKPSLYILQENSKWENFRFFFHLKASSFKHKFHRTKCLMTSDSERVMWDKKAISHLWRDWLLLSRNTNLVVRLLKYDEINMLKLV